MHCPKCGQEMPDTAKFCGSCGNKVEGERGGDVCTKCGADVKPGAKFCQTCGAPQVSGEQTERAREAKWEDIEMDQGGQPRGRNMRATLLPILVVPVVVAAIFLLSRNKTEAPHQQSTEAQQQAGMASMENVFAQLDSLKSVVQENPRDTTALLVLAEMYEIAKMSEQARDYYEKFLEVSPGNVDVQLRIANTYFNEKNFASARELLESVLNKQPENPYALYNYGLTLHMSGEIEEAESTWQKVARLDPSGEVGNQARQALQVMEQMRQQRAAAQEQKTK